MARKSRVSFGNVFGWLDCEGLAECSPQELREDLVVCVEE
jgi:hypothetical protein